MFSHLASKALTQDIHFNHIFIFLGKTWPLAFGTGVGLGMGYSNCQNDFQQPYLIHGKRIKVIVQNNRIKVYMYFVNNPTKFWCNIIAHEASNL